MVQQSVRAKLLWLLVPVAVLMSVVAACSTPSKAAPTVTVVTTKLQPSATITTVSYDDYLYQHGAACPEDSCAGSTSAAFTSPGGNIQCFGSLADPRTDTEAVDCTISDREWEPAPRPEGCVSQFGDGASLKADGSTDLTCLGDPIPRDGKVLPIGARLMIGKIACTMTDAGVECAVNGHGFRVGRSAIERF